MNIAGVIVIIALLYVGYELYSQGIIIPQVDDAYLASLEASYFEDSDRLVVALILTNKDAEYTKANGHLELKVLKGVVRVYSNEYDFTKDDFFHGKPILEKKLQDIELILMKNSFLGNMMYM